MGQRLHQTAMQGSSGPRTESAEAVRDRVIDDPGNWLAVGHACVRMPARLVRAADRCLRVMTRLPTKRIGRERWIRWRVDLEGHLAGRANLLVPLGEADIAGLRTHAEHDADQIVSGFRFWEHGLRRAYSIQQDGAPLAQAWLLTAQDNPRLRTLPTWSGLYPPLPDGVGQMENTHLFRAGRRNRIATEFMQAAFATAGSLGLAVLWTHIADTNTVVLARAERFGWHRCGTIVRYRFDVPGLRHLPVCLHTVAPPGRV